MEVFTVSMVSFGAAPSRTDEGSDCQVEGITWWRSSLGGEVACRSGADMVIILVIMAVPSLSLGRCYDNSLWGHLAWLVLSAVEGSGGAGEMETWVTAGTLWIPACASRIVWEHNRYGSKTQTLWESCKHPGALLKPIREQETASGEGQQRRIAEDNSSEHSQLCSILCTSAPRSTRRRSPAVLRDEHWQPEQWDVFLQQQKNQALCVKTNADTLPKAGQSSKGLPTGNNAVWRLMEQSLAVSLWCITAKSIHKHLIKMNLMAGLKLLFQKLNASYQCVKMHNQHCIHKSIPWSNL